MDDYDHLMKIAVVGDSAVGKTSLLLRFVDDEYRSSYSSTIGVDFNIKMMELDGKIIKLQIWDTAGQERFRAIVNSYYRGAHVVIIAFDLSDRESFMHVPKWYDETMRHAVETKLILVGCKSDLEHEVSRQEIDDITKEYDMSYYECSAKKYSNNGIDNIFEGIIRSNINLAEKTRIKPLTVFEPAMIDSNYKCCTIL